MTETMIAVYRVRRVLLTAGCVILLAIAVVAPLFSGDAARAVTLVLGGIAAVGIAVALLSFVLGPGLLPTRATVVVSSPVRGRWLALNSPATAVPSHGVRAYGQAFAIDLVHEPRDASRPVFGTGAAFRAPADYPAFGQPVFAMIDGVVTSAAHRHRDHRSRSTMAALNYLMVEGAVRELGGPGFLLGNHVTIRSIDGIFATVAHLARDSVTVRVGDTVRAGDRVARCGNSGNSSEPHVHAQLADRASLSTAQGIPMAFAAITLDDGSVAVDALPENEQYLTAH